MATKTKSPVTMVATSAIEPFRLLKLTAASGTAVEHNGVGESAVFGFSEEQTAADKHVLVELFGRFITHKAEAAEAFAAGATLYAAADGKVKDSAAGSAIGTALEAATGDGSIVSILADLGTASVNNPLQNIIVDPGDAGAIPIGSSGICKLVTAGAETRTVADASFAGQQLLLAMKTDAGDCVVTFASPFNQAGDMTITLDTAGDAALFTAVEDGADIEWRLLGEDGCSDMIGETHSDLDTVIVDPGDGGAIPVTGSGSVSLVTGGAETRTVADATYKGQQLALSMKTDAGDCVVTFASPFNQATNDNITFADVGDFALFLAIEDGADIEWRLVANDGGALA